MHNHAMLRIAAAMTLLRFADASGVRRIADLLRAPPSQAWLELAAPILALPDNGRNQPLKAKIDLVLLKHFAGQFQSALHVRVLQALPHFTSAPALTLIRKYLTHFSPYVRAAAAEALCARAPTPATRALLARRWRRERAPFARIRLARLLNRPELMDCVVGYLRHEDYFLRATAVEALAAAGGASGAEAVLPLLNDAHFYVRLCAVAALEKFPGRAAAAAVARRLNDENPRVRLQAAKYVLATEQG